MGVVSLGLASVPAALTSVRLGLESLSLRDQVPRHGRAGLLGSAWVDLIGTTGARDPGSGAEPHYSPTCSGALTLLWAVNWLRRFP